MTNSRASVAKADTACLPALPSLPSLAQQRILAHCSSADLAVLRSCSRAHREFVDATVTRLYPWIVDATPAPAPALAPTPLSGLFAAAADLASVSAATAAAVGAAPHHALGGGPYGSLQELILRHHPHLDRRLDPSIASYDVEGGHFGASHRGAFNAQHHTIHLPRRLMGGMVCLSTMPALTSLAASLLCLADVPSAFAAARDDLDRSGGGEPPRLPAQWQLRFDRIAAVAAAAAGGGGAAAEEDAGEAGPAAGYSHYRAAWLNEVNALRVRNYRRALLARLREGRLEKQMTAAVQQLTALAPRLTALTLTDVPFLAETFQALAGFRVLRHLVLSARTGGDGAGASAAGAAAAAASSCSVHSGQLLPEHLAVLIKGLEQLQHLDLHAGSFDPATDFGALSALTHLSYIRLNQAALYNNTYGNRFERLPADFTREVLLEPLRGLERLATLPQLHSLALTGLDCPPCPLLEALPPGSGPLRCLALRKMYRLSGRHLEAVGRLTGLTELQLGADWWLHPGCDRPPPLEPLELLNMLMAEPEAVVEGPEEEGPEGGQDLQDALAVALEAADAEAGEQAGAEGGGAAGGAAAPQAAAAAVPGPGPLGGVDEMEVERGDGGGSDGTDNNSDAGRRGGDIAGAPSSAVAAVVAAAGPSSEPESGRVLRPGAPARSSRLPYDTAPSASSDSTDSHAPAGLLPDSEWGWEPEPSVDQGSGGGPGPSGSGAGPSQPGRRGWYGQEWRQGQELAQNWDWEDVAWPTGLAAAAAAAAAGGRGPGGQGRGHARSSALDGLQQQQQPQQTAAGVEAPKAAAAEAPPPPPPPQEAQPPQQQQALLGAVHIGGVGPVMMVLAAQGIPPGALFGLPHPGVAGAAWQIHGGGLGGGGGGGGGGGVAGGVGWGGSLVDERLEPLRRLQKLQVLHLSVGRIFGVVNLGPRFLAPLSALTALNSITLRCITVDWKLLSVLAPLPRLQHLSMHYYEGQSNNGVKIAADLLTWRNLSAVTTLNLGAFEAHTDAHIITRALPRSRVAVASVFGMRGCRPRYDVFAALALTTSLTSLTVQGDWMVARAFGRHRWRSAAPTFTAAAATAPSDADGNAVGAPATSVAALWEPYQTLSALRQLPLLRRLCLDPSGSIWMTNGDPDVHIFDDVVWVLPQPAAAAAAPVPQPAIAVPNLRLPPPPPALPPLHAAQPAAVTEVAARSGPAAAEAEAAGRNVAAAPWPCAAGQAAAVPSTPPPPPLPVATMFREVPVLFLSSDESEEEQGLRGASACAGGDAHTAPCAEAATAAVSLDRDPSVGAGAGVDVDLDADTDAGSGAPAPNDRDGPIDVQPAAEPAAGVGSGASGSCPASSAPLHASHPGSNPAGRTGPDAGAGLNSVGRWLLQLGTVTQLTDLRLESWGVVPPAALSPLVALRRLQLMGLKRLDADLLMAISRLPSLAYLALEGRSGAHLGCGAYVSLSRVPYMSYSAVDALASLTRLRLLLLTGFTLVPPPPPPPPSPQSQPRPWPQPHHQLPETATSSAVGGGAAAGARAAAAAAAPIGRFHFRGDGGGGVRRGRCTAAEGDEDDAGMAALRRLLAGLGRLQGLRYLGLCLMEALHEATDITRLCAALPGLRMLSLPADAASRCTLPGRVPGQGLAGLREAVGRIRRGASGAAAVAAAAGGLRAAGPSGSAAAAGAGAAYGPRGGAGAGGSRVGQGRSGDRASWDAADESDPGGEAVEGGAAGSGGVGGSGGAAGSTGTGSRSEAGSVSEEAGGRGGAGRGGAGRGLSGLAAGLVDVRPLTDELEGVRAAVYGGLTEVEFWQVVEGLDEEMRREGALVGGEAWPDRPGEPTS